MDHNAEFHRCLVDCDVGAIRKLWQHVSPHLPQPKDDHEALLTIHHARTQARSISARMRFYSHRWLLDHGYPSGLPDGLKPRAERMYPRIADAVGISVNARLEYMRPLVSVIRGAMSDAVLEAYADGRKEPKFVKARMMDARAKILRQ